MRDKDFTFLFAFIKRAGMYTASVEEHGFKGVGAFLYAYELGSDGKCDFKRHLIKRITDKYDAPPHSAGFEYQLKESADKLGKEWHKMFQITANETLVNLSDADGENRFVKLIREHLLSKLKNIGNTIHDSWIINWHHVTDQIEEWKGVNISKDEKDEFRSLKANLESLTANNLGYSEIIIPDEIKAQIAGLINLVQLNNEG